MLKCNRKGNLRLRIKSYRHSYKVFKGSFADLLVDNRTFRLVLAVVVFTVVFIVLVTLVTVWSGATYYTNSVVNNTLYPTASPVPLSSVSTLAFALSLTLLIVIFILGVLLIYYLVKWATEKLAKPQYWA